MQLESNGYNVKGWAKNKQEESELPDTKPDTFAVSERKRQLRLTTVLLGGLFVAYVFYRLFHYFFDPAAPIAAALEEGIEETLDNTTFLNATDSQPILDLEGTLVEEVMVDAQPEMA